MNFTILLFTRYDVELFQRIEQLTGKKMPQFQTEEEEVMQLQERVAEAQRIAAQVLILFIKLKYSAMLGEDESGTHG